MKQLSILTLSAALLGLFGCSDSSNTPTTTPATAPTATPQQTTAPAANPMTPQQQAAVTAAKDMPKQGVVKEMMHAAGYTYMNVDTEEGKPLWIAATMMRVKLEDKVQWADAAAMHNFNSKSLHRTFDKILFVSSASVVK